MRNITVKTHPSSALLKKEDQLAWKIAEIAADKSRPSAETIEMVINRIIDNASVAIASLNRKPVISARDMALAHPKKNGATLFGIDPKIKVHCEWAAVSLLVTMAVVLMVVVAEVGSSLVVSGQ